MQESFSAGISSVCTVANEKSTLQLLENTVVVDNVPWCKDYFQLQAMWKMLHPDNVVVHFREAKVNLMHPAVKILLRLQLLR